MRVVLKNRTDALLRMGGDTIEMLETKSSLEERGHEVSISLDPFSIEEADLIHIFNLNRPGDSYLHAIAGKEHGKVVVLSAIYWNEEEFLERAIYPSTMTRRLVHSLHLPERIRGILKNTRDRLRGKKVSEGIFLERRIGLKEVQKSLLSIVDFVITGSRVEMEALRRDFGYVGKGAVIPKGIHSRFLEETREENPWSLRPDFVLSVGRIERHKNQLSSIRALKKLKIDLVLAGEPNPEEKDYSSLCRELSGEKVHFLGPVEHQKLPPLYRLARVHLQPSWYEIPGLATLEAAVSGCNVVVTNKGSAYEYLREMAWYVDPSDDVGIRDAVEEAYHSPPKDELREHLIDNFRWERIARLLEEAYLLALSS